MFRQVQQGVRRRSRPLVSVYNALRPSPSVLRPQRSAIMAAAAAAADISTEFYWHNIVFKVCGYFLQ
jgi:hypothetical protein